MKKSKTLLGVVCLAMVALIAVFGTVAYLSDRDSETNVFTSGDVSIDLTEQYSDGSQLLPGVMVNKTVTITNDGKNDAWVWYTYAIPKNIASEVDVFGNDQWDTTTIAVSEKEITVNEVKDTYMVYTCLWKEPLAVGKSLEGMTGVQFDASVDYYDGKYYTVVEGVATEVGADDLADANILVAAYAIQKDEFKTVKEAYDAYWGQWKENGEAEYGIHYDVTIPEDDTESTAKEIIEYLEGGQSVYLEKSMDLTDPSPGYTYIKLNGDVVIGADDDVVINFGETALIQGNGTLTVYGGQLKTNYELCVTGDSELIINGGEHTFGAFSATGNGKITVNDGILNCKGTYAGVMGISFAENGQLIVNGGTLNMYQPFNLNANRCDNAYIEINGGTIDLLNGIENLFVVRNIMDKDRADGGVLRGSSIRVNGGTFIAHYEIDSAGDATSFIRNGDAPADTNKVLVSNIFNEVADYDCAVTGGTFYGSWQRADNQRYTNGNGGKSDGKFVENSIAGFVSDGYQITGDPTNGYVVTKK